MTTKKKSAIIDTWMGPRYAVEINGVSGWYEIAEGTWEDCLLKYKRPVARNPRMGDLPYRIITKGGTQND